MAFIYSVYWRRRVGGFEVVYEFINSSSAISCSPTISLGTPTTNPAGFIIVKSFNCRLRSLVDTVE